MNKEEYIQDYFAERLNEEELKKFQIALKSDPDLKKSYEEYLVLREASKLREQQELKKELIDLESDHNKQDKKLSYKILLATAAAAIVTLVFFSLNGPDSDMIFEQYYKEYPNTYKPVVRDNTRNDPAFIAYENKDYEKSERLLQELLVDDISPDLRFYLALSQMAQEKYQEAGRELDQIIQTDFEYQAEALWYRTLIHIQAEEYLKAKNLLDLMNNLNTNFKQEERQEILVFLNEELSE